MTKYRVAVVVLNYNDSKTTVGFVEEMLSLGMPLGVVVVDNCSRDEEWEELQGGIGKTDAVLVRTKRNGGYASGNNIGIRRAIDEFSCNYIIVANPDVHFTRGFVGALIHTFETHLDAGEVSGLMNDPTKAMEPALKLPSIGQCIYSDLPAFMKLHNVIAVRPDQLSDEPCEVGQLYGSLFMISRRAYEDIGGFDEGTFLFYEEAILGARLEQHGYKRYLVPGVSYDHVHSTSIRKSIPSLANQLDIMYESQRYYCKKYLKANAVQMALLRAAAAIGKGTILLNERVRSSHTRYRHE